MACYVSVVTYSEATSFGNHNRRSGSPLLIAESCETMQVVAEAMRPYEHLSSVSACRNRINIPRFGQ